jgi:tetratricopeptide (TPR) repeat protein
MVGLDLFIYQDSDMQDISNLFPNELPIDRNAYEFYELGLRYARVAWWELARQALNKCIELGPNQAFSIRAKTIMQTELPKYPVPDEAQELSSQANNFIADSDFKNARHILEKLIIHYPDFEPPFYLLALLHLNEHNIQQAKGLVNYLNTLNKEYIDTFELSAGVCAAEKDYEQAIQFLNRYLNFRRRLSVREFKYKLMIAHNGEPPDNCPEDLDSESFYDLGELYAWRWRSDLAREAFNKGTEVNSSNIFAKKLNLAVRTLLPISLSSDKLSYKINEINEAKSTKDRIEMLTELMITDKSDILAFALANALVAEKNYTRACELLKLSLEINPYFENAQVFLIDLLCIEKRFTEAIELIQTWINQNPDLPELERFKARIEMRLNIYHRGSSTEWHCPQ